MQTSKEIIIPRTKFKAVRTGLGSKIRINLDYPNSLQFGFIANELLQLEETPTVEPSVKSFSHKLVPALSYTFKVLQDNCVSRTDNLFTYIMVNPTHITFLPTRKLLQKPLSRLCAFTLEFSPQILVLHNLGLMTFENLAIRTDSKVVYSDINTQNPVSTRRWSVDVSGKSNVKEQLSFPISNDFKSLVFPIKIFPIIFGNIYRNIFSLSWSKSSQSNLLKVECKKIPIEADRTRLHNRLLFKFNSFKILRSFCYGFTSKISRKPFPNVFINKMVKLKSVAYLGFKTFVNSILNSLKKSITHTKQFLVMPNFQLYSGDRFHSNILYHRLYISLMAICPVEVSVNSPPD